MAQRLSGNPPAYFLTALSMIIMLTSCSTGSRLSDYTEPHTDGSGQKGAVIQNLYPQTAGDLSFEKADTETPGILPEPYLGNGSGNNEIRNFLSFVSVPGTSAGLAEKTGNTAGNLPEIPEDEDRAYLQPDADADESTSYADAGDPFYEKFSRILGLHLDGTEDRELIAIIDKWLGTPYRMGGCSESGIDCSCLIRTIYEDVYGITLSRTSRTIFRELTPVKKEELQEGDIICFKNRKKRISHVGLYLKDGNFVHASRKNGVTISNLSEKYYLKRYAGAGRVVPIPSVKLSKMIPSEPTSRQ